MVGKFKTSESREIKRIHDMIRFFENRSCLSKELARYFGETIPMDNCGHCSVCEGHPVTIEQTMDRKPLQSISFNGLVDDFLGACGAKGSDLNTTKFLCGVPSPFLMKIKAKTFPNFGCLQYYPFMKVLQWVQDNGDS